MYKKELIAENKNKFFIYLYLLSHEKISIFSESTRIHKCDDTHSDLILKTKICPPYKVILLLYVKNLNAEEMANEETKRTEHCILCSNSQKFPKQQ